MRQMLKGLDVEAEKARARAQWLAHAAAILRHYGLEGDTSPDFMSFEFDPDTSTKVVLFALKYWNHNFNKVNYEK
jgi:hypothetical protein